MIGIRAEHAPLVQPGATGLRAHYAATNLEDQVLRSANATTKVIDEEIGDFRVVRPSIQFQPSWIDFAARSERLAKQREGLPIRDLPEGFPQEITGTRAWSGRDVKSLDGFIIELSGGDIAEIEAALAYFRNLPGNNGPDQVCKDLFPLKSLGSRLETVSQDVHTGRGLAILRGLPDPAKYTPWENVVLFAGLTSYIGERIGCQDRYGNMLTHLVDMGSKYGQHSKRTPAFTSEALPYHNDVCDILAMSVQSHAPIGGETTLAPSAAVYNEIALARPDLIHTLSSPIWIYDKDETPSAWAPRPILFPEPTHGPFFCFSRQKITGSKHYPLSPDLPPMTDEQAEALDAVHYAAEKHGLKMRLRQGDLVFCNNFGLLHGREAFKDGGEEDAGMRHILRLWVRNESLAWKTPEELEKEWFAIYGESERRGMAQWRIKKEDTDRERVIGHKMTCS